MAKHHQTGKTGELLARRWLQERGFDICHCNWRHGYDEIDIIACRNGVLHFVEVKTRSSLRYGFPETAVTLKKLKRWLRAIDAFLTEYPHWNRIQLDICCVQLSRHQQPDVRMIEDISVLLPSC